MDTRYYPKWRYATLKDFTNPEGQGFSYASDGHQQWGDEITKISFDTSQPREACVSSDGRRLALAVDYKIHIFDTENFDRICVLIGHTCKISELAFQPYNSNVLVSAQMRDHKKTSTDQQRSIIIWNITEWQEKSKLDDSASGIAAKAAIATVASEFKKLGVTLGVGDIKELEAEVTPALDRVAAKHEASGQIYLHGRLLTHFQSQVFSPSGKWMLYLPGDRPLSNRIDDGYFSVVSTNGFKEHLSVKGHTDSIMWTSWSPDESILASVSWDGTIRTWDAETGENLHRFETNRQNWTGAFSPDSKYLAATDGLANVYVYDLAAGDDEVHWKFNTDKKQQYRRALAWHPDGNLLAVGGDFTGEVLLLDVNAKQLVQERRWYVTETKDNEDARPVLGMGFTVTQVRFVDHGKKLAFFIGGDASIEVYDLEEHKKWRFAKGTEDGPQAENLGRGAIMIHHTNSHGMLAWEDIAKKLLMLASIDTDGVRIWSVKLGEA